MHLYNSTHVVIITWPTITHKENGSTDYSWTMTNDVEVKGFVANVKCARFHDGLTTQRYKRLDYTDA